MSLLPVPTLHRQRGASTGLVQSQHEPCHELREREQCSLAAACNGFKCHHPITVECSAVPVWRPDRGIVGLLFFLRDLAVDFPDYFDKQNKFM